MTHPGLAVMLMVGVGLGAAIYYFFANSPEPPMYNRNNRQQWNYSQTSHRSRSQYCTICCDDINDDERVKLSVCKHIFHKKCIENWRSNGFGDGKHNCPVCRETITTVLKI